jgi:hypothetical protein
MRLDDRFKVTGQTKRCLATIFEPDTFAAENS